MGAHLLGAQPVMGQGIARAGVQRHAVSAVFAGDDDIGGAGPGAALGAAADMQAAFDMGASASASARVSTLDCGQKGAPGQASTRSSGASGFHRSPERGPGVASRSSSTRQGVTRIALASLSRIAAARSAA